MTVSDANNCRYQANVKSQCLS